MFEKSKVLEVVGGLNTELSMAFQKFIDARGAVIAKLTGVSAEANDALQAIRQDVEAVAKGTFYEGVRVADFFSTMSVYEEDGKLDCIKLTVKSKPSVKVSYRKCETIPVDENVVSAMCAVYQEALIQILYSQYATQNLDEVNAYVKELCTEAEVPYTFEFAVGDKFVMSASDEKVVFGTSVANALEATTLSAFGTGDEFSEYVASAEKERCIETLKTIQNVPQLIRANLPLVVTLVGVKTLKRADSLIRLSYHQQAKYLKGNGTSLGYFSDKVDINGEEVSVFAILQRDDEGKFSVVLSPFDTKTNFNVDFDVVAEVEKSLSK